MSSILHLRIRELFFLKEGIRELLSPLIKELKISFIV